MQINLLLFDDFETLDAFGPVEVLGRAEGYTVRHYSEKGGVVYSSQGVPVVTEPFEHADLSGILLLPGGMGTRNLVKEQAFLDMLKRAAEQALYVLTVCTGSALLAATGLLDGKRATSNKRSFEWVRGTGAAVLWQPSARWVVDGKYYTSSGVSAGTDMAFGFFAERFGDAEARALAHRLEYIWHDDKDSDPFAVTI